jgi:hypothetical protein
MKLFLGINDISYIRKYVRNSANHLRGNHGTTAILEFGIRSMVVKIRFANGPVVSRRGGKNGRLATLAASVLTMVSISCASLAIWRLGTDLEWAGDFVFPNGFLSHWQVWLGAAIAVQYLGWRLSRYAQTATLPEPGEPAKDSAAEAATANV